MSAEIAQPRRNLWREQLLESAQMPLLVAVSYWLGAKAAFLIGTLSDKIFAPFWPPNIVLLCALLFIPTRKWWLCILAALPAHAAAEFEVGMDSPQMLVAFVTNCMVALGSAFAIRQLIGNPPWFDTLQKSLLYVLITAVASPAIAALGGAFVPIMGGGAPQDYWTFWTQWYASNALGAVTVGPIALIWLSERTSWSTWKDWRPSLDGFLMVVALVVVCVFAFDLTARTMGMGFGPCLLYLPLPLILWSALRFGARGATGAIFIVTVVLIWRALNAPSLFGTQDPESNVLGMQAFLMGLGIPIMLLGSSIEEKRKGEEAIRESEERMAFAAASANACLWHFGRNPHRFWMTDHGRKMFGFGANETITRHALLNLVHPDDRDTLMETLRSPRLIGQSVDPEFRILRRDGQTRWIRACARTHSNEHGEQIEVSGTFTDVTERKAVEQEATAQRRETAHLTRVSMIGGLSAGLAHELTQPLTAILSNAQTARHLLDARNPDPNELIELLEDIIAEDNRASEVIQRLRGLLKKGDTKLEPVDLNDLIRSTLHLLHSELISRRIKIATDLDRNLPIVSGDAIQLQQVMINLLMNAMDAVGEKSPTDRVVTIASKQRGPWHVEVNVVDRGPGIDPLKQERMFQPFFTTKERGLGLGLPICSSIIKSHGGVLDVLNSPAGGAKAVFRLPTQGVKAGSP